MKNKKILITILILLLIGNVFCLTASASDSMLVRSQYVDKIQNIAQLYQADNQFVYFGRVSCAFCQKFEQFLLEVIEKEQQNILYFDTDSWREDGDFESTLQYFDIKTVPSLIYIQNGSLEDNFSIDSSQQKNYVEKIQAFITNYKMTDQNTTFFSNLHVYVFIFLLLTLLSTLLKRLRFKHTALLICLTKSISFIIVFLISIKTIWHSAIYIDQHGLRGNTMDILLVLGSGILCIICIGLQMVHMYNKKTPHP